MTIPLKSWRDWFLFLFVFPGFTSFANRAERKAGGTAKQYQSLDWHVVAYFVIVGLDATGPSHFSGSLDDTRLSRA
jgi:hypothetical protein